MATTLSDLNDQLVEQNKSQSQTTDELGTLNTSVVRMTTGIEALLRQFETDKLQDLENEREQQTQNRRVVSSVSRNTSSTGTSGNGLFGGDFLEKLKTGGLLGLGAGLISALPGFLLKRGLPSLLANAFADEIADYVEDATGSEALGDAVFRGLKLGSLGLLISKRLGLIGFAIGAVLTPENREKFEELGSNLQEVGDKLANLFGVELPEMSKLAESISSTVGNAADGINSLITDGFDSEEFQSNIGSIGASLAGLAFLFKPLGTVSLMLKTIAYPFKKLYSGFKALGGLILGGTAINNLNKTQIGEISKEDIQRMNTKQIQGMSADDIKKLEGEGYKVNQKTGSVTTLKGNPVSPDQVRSSMSNLGMENPLNQAAAKKYSKFGKLLKVGRSIPFLGTLLSAGTLGAILMSDASENEKADTIGRLFGGAAGALALGAIGATAGPFGAIAGAIGGGLLGDELGSYFAKWIMGGGLSAGGLGGSESVGDYGEFGNIGNEYTNETSKISAPTPVMAPMINDLNSQLQSIASNTQPVVVYTDASNNSVTQAGGEAVVSAPLGYAGISQSDWNDYLKA